ncbi:MAG: hypothetical protein JXR25_09235 [Pontiellaceae bacterium]|nr:hypothetical protein [Pontiellaceae bacterium]MBN2784998.1 hypothetical protein [Pontiellaceae bacterium]
MEEKSNTHKERSDSHEVILDLNFVPQWARKPPGESHYSRKEYEPKTERNERRGGRRDDRREDRPRRPRRDSGEDRGERRPRPDPARELPVGVSFLPEQKRLASLVRQIHHSRRAYPLMDLANLLIQDAEGYLVKLEVDKTSDLQLFQCRCCKAVCMSEEAVRQHIMGRHLADFYSEDVIEGEAPSGSFPGVARCRKTGILLGPPNHHSYIEKLTELHQSRFPHLSLDEVKQQVEVVRDEELIEQWREESRRQTMYRSRRDTEAEPLNRRQVELAFARDIEKHYEPVHRAIVPSKVAQQLEDRDLVHTIHQVWIKESRFPLSMSFSMRAAFRHMHLHLFKAGKVNFVTHIKPHPVAPEDTVPNIAEVLMFLKENPGSTRMHVLEVLHPSLDPKSLEAKEALKPLSWLIERGHIIEFFNGTLAIPIGRRRNHGK